MAHRVLTGSLTLADGTTILAGRLTVKPYGPRPADDDGLLLPQRVDYLITDGAIEEGATIQTPAHYQFIISDANGTPLDSWRAAVPAGDTAISLQDIYLNTHGGVSIPSTVSDMIAAAIAAHIAAADPHAQYVEAGEGGSGDMMQATYDPDGDGTVSAADVANAVAWANITGTPATFPAEAHTHDDRYFRQAEVEALLGTKVDATEKGTAGGVATLGPDSKLPASQIPAIAITDTFVVADEPGMLATDAETGDVCVRTDESRCYILAGTDPADIGHWQLLLTPTSPVSSVNGQVGAVTLTAADVGAASAPVGFIGEFGGPVAPEGWALCNGQALSRADDAALYAVIGTLYGTGDGSTTFNVPDLRGRVAIGAAAATDHALGMTGGTNTSVYASNSFQPQPEIVGGELAITYTLALQENRPAYQALNYIIKR